MGRSERREKKKKKKENVSRKKANLVSLAVEKTNQLDNVRVCHQLHNIQLSILSVVHQQAGKAKRAIRHGNYFK